MVRPILIPSLRAVFDERDNQFIFYIYAKRKKIVLNKSIQINPRTLNMDKIYVDREKNKFQKICFSL